MATRRPGLIRALVLGALMSLAGMATMALNAAEPDAYIPEQPLSEALRRYAELTGLHIVYISSLASGRTSHWVPNGLSASAAMARLLSGTGLDFVFLNAQTVKIFSLPATELHRSSANEQTAAGSTLGLREIVVTATKREEALSHVPISANVLTAQDMEVSGVNGITDIAAMTPGVEYDYSSQWGPGILTNLAIRGINSNVATSTTGIYVDDVPVQARTTNFGNPYPVSFDLNRVEVLRGPQGTLFGAGAEGGAIRYIANEPSLSNYGGFSQLEVAQTQNGGLSYEAGAAGGGPIVDGTFGVRLSAWYRKDGGYVDHVDPLNDTIVDSNANRSFTRTTRLAFAWAPSDSLRITTSGNYQSARIHDTPNFFPYLSTPTDGILRNGKLLRQPAVDSFALAAVKLEQQVGSLELSTVTAYFNRLATASIDTTNESGVYYFGTFGNPLGPAYPTSYAQAVPTLLTLHQSQLSQEVRLSSANTSTPIRWVAGLYISRERQNDTRDSYGMGGPQDPGLYLGDSTTDILIAGFGNFDITVARRWRLSFGARVDYIRDEFLGYEGGFVYPTLPPLTRGVTEQTPLTPRLSVSYTTAGNLFGYASVAKGFRIGGVNARIPNECSSSAIPTTYGSDSVWSHEIGIKDILLDGRLGIDTSIYEIDWSRIQQSVAFDCGFAYTANAGAAKSAGFDLAMRAKLTERLGFDLSVGFLKVHYTESVLNTAGEVIAGRGAVVGGAPSVPAPWSGSASVHNRWPMPHNVDGYARADDIFHSHNSGPFTENDPKAIGYDPRLSGDPAFNQINLQLGLIRGTLFAKLFVNNALNAQPPLQRYADARGSSLIYAYTLRPRTVGLACSWTY